MDDVLRPFGDGNGIQAMSTPGVTAADALQGQPASPGRAMQLKGLDGVFGTARPVTAGGWKDGTPGALVATDGQGQGTGEFTGLRLHQPPRPALRAGGWFRRRAASCNSWSASVRSRRLMSDQEGWEEASTLACRRIWARAYWLLAARFPSGCAFSRKRQMRSTACRMSASPARRQASRRTRLTVLRRTAARTRRLGTLSCSEGRNGRDDSADDPVSGDTGSGDTETGDTETGDAGSRDPGDVSVCRPVSGAFASLAVRTGDPVSSRKWPETRMVPAPLRRTGAAPDLGLRASGEDVGPDGCVGTGCCARLSMQKRPLPREAGGRLGVGLSEIRRPDGDGLWHDGRAARHGHHAFSGEPENHEFFYDGRRRVDRCASW